jgi:putative ATPase
MVIANAAAQAFEYVGLPEGIFPLVHATLYLSTAPKSNTATHYFKAFDLIEKEGRVDVPLHLRDANRDGKALGHGKDYAYPHDDPDHYLPQQYLPKDVLGTYFYNPSEVGYEVVVRERLDRWREAQRRALGIEKTETIPDLSEDEIRDIKGKHKATR